jgi:WD40 repeat protein
VLSAAFSSDGKTLASSSLDKTITLWDVERRVPLSIPLTGHTDVVLAVAFSPDGKTLASSSNDKTVILWDVASRRRIGRPLARHKQEVKALAFSPDGKTLATGSADRTIILWDVNLEFDSQRACRIANRNLSMAESNQFIGADSPYQCTCPDLPSGEGAPPCR